MTSSAPTEPSSIRNISSVTGGSISTAPSPSPCTPRTKRLLQQQLLRKQLSPVAATVVAAVTVDLAVVTEDSAVLAEMADQEAEEVVLEVEAAVPEEVETEADLDLEADKEETAEEMAVSAVDQAAVLEVDHLLATATELLVLEVKAEETSVEEA